MGDRPESENLGPSNSSLPDGGGIQQKTPEIRDPEPDEAHTSFEVIDLGERADKVEPRREIPEQKRAPDKKEPTASEAMVTALSRFIQEQTANAREQSNKRAKFTARQVTVFLLLTADVVLAYMSLPPEILGAPVIKFVSALLPWLLGASAFAYAEKLRGWFLGRCSNPWVGGSSLLAFALLLPMQLPLFSTYVKLNPMTSLKAENAKRVELHFVGDGAKLLFFGFNSYTIIVQNTDINIRNAKDLRVTLGRWQIAQTTLAQVPLIGRLFGSNMISLTPLYSFNVKTSNGSENIEVEGYFPPGFVDTLDYSHMKKNGGHYILSPHIILGGTYPLDLPSGTYDFRARQANCLKVQKGWTVRGSTETVIPKLDFDKLPCSSSD